MVIIDAENTILGRLASNVSERLLKGETIHIVNAEKAIITGSKVEILKRYEHKINLRVKGNPHKGPKLSRRADLLVRRSIRGMLPYKASRGRSALKRLRVYIGFPKEFQKAEIEAIESIKFKGSKKFVEIGEISKLLGMKV
ncbi:MAG: 50S ribosomal protein L13 [archaeon]|nr:50S ribosomal protein L13 [archaeon]